MNNIFSFVFKIFAFPLSIIYLVVSSNRRMLYRIGFFKQYSFRLPIISIGNLTMGGSGKTPLTLWIGKFIESHHKKTMVVMRGYKGALEKAGGIISSSRSIGISASDFGDEAILYKRKLSNCSVLVGKNRVLNLLKYYKQEEADVALLDDGFQHLKISPDLNILLFDVSLPMHQYKVVPMGYMREHMNAAVNADVIILNRCELVDNDTIKLLEDKISLITKKLIPIYRTKYIFKYIYDKDDKIHFTELDLSSLNIIAFAGIASPENFFKNLKGLNANLVETYSFDDHKEYTIEILEKLRKSAKESNSILITTEKDIVKLSKISDINDVYYLGMELKFINNNNELDLKNRILKTLRLPL